MLTSPPARAVLQFLAKHNRLRGETLERDTLSARFDIRGQQFRLIGPQDIFKPKVLGDQALSLTAVGPTRDQPRSHDDEFQAGATGSHKHRGTEANHYNDQWVRDAMRARAPLIYFHATGSERVLEEPDGPMLKPGLQEIHETLIELPRSENQRPDRDGLNRRYKDFERPIV